MLELEKNGNWYSIWLDYDGYGTLHKAHGVQELNELIADLIHDVKIDGQYSLVQELQALKK
jgi:hypothetical protein